MDTLKKSEGRDKQIKKWGGLLAPWYISQHDFCILKYNSRLSGGYTVKVNSETF
jgi:hypothetical protein